MRAICRILLLFHYFCCCVQQNSSKSTSGGVVNNRSHSQHNIIEHSVELQITRKIPPPTFEERISAGVDMSGHIKHCLQSRSFVILLNGKKSVLDYRVLPNKVLDLYHTEVPVEHRGQGYAAQLVKGAFDYAQTENFKVLPTCTYVAKYAREMATPAEKNLIVKS